MELLSVVHKQGLGGFSEVERCVLEPNGTFYLEPIKPSPEESELESLRSTLQALHEEVRAMRQELTARGSA
ncbi:MAG: hypothetical protein NVSMB62_30080 [Acidobacteriaceae bacterium]